MSLSVFDDKSIVGFSEPIFPATCQNPSCGGYGESIAEYRIFFSTRTYLVCKACNAVLIKTGKTKLRVVREDSYEAELPNRGAPAKGFEEEDPNKAKARIEQKKAVVAENSAKTAGMISNLEIQLSFGAVGVDLGDGTVSFKGAIFRGTTFVKWVSSNEEEKVADESDRSRIEGLFDTKFIEETQEYHNPANTLTIIYSRIGNYWYNNTGRWLRGMKKTLVNSHGKSTVEMTFPKIDKGEYTSTPNDVAEVMRKLSEKEEEELRNKAAKDAEIEFNRIFAKAE